jgi:hypothetical protein
MILSKLAVGQEFNCQVIVNSSNVNNAADKQLFVNMQNQITEFINNRKWTNDVFLQNEKISMNITLLIENRISTNEFKATAQIQSVRPVYKSGYNSVLFNYSDADWTFEYTEFQPMDYNDATFTNNLTQMLAYYVYIVLGFDYDSFESEGGNPYFAKAQSVVSNSQNASQSGWKQSESLRNRYWLISTITSPSCKPIRQSVYQYHRLGLDKMYETKNQEAARDQIIKALESIQKSHKEKPGTMYQQVYLNTKKDELVSIFADATGQEKNKVLTILNEIDAINSLFYQNMKQN